MAVKKKPAPKKTAPRRNKRGEGLNPDSAYGKAILSRTEDKLTPAMKVRRDIFISEYMVDFNAAQAWLRMKARHEPEDLHKEYTAAECAEHGYRMTREPYVAKRIQELMDSMSQAELINANRVLGMAIREANYHGLGAQHGGRVNAIKLLADLLSMTSTAKAATARNDTPKGNTGPRGGVMLVPATESEKGWEARSKAAQARLKEEVRK